MGTSRDQNSAEVIRHRIALALIDQKDAVRNFERRIHAHNIPIEFKAIGRTIGAAVEPYDPDAEDGDEDGKVQDNTPWERTAPPKKPKRGVFEQVAGAVADAAEAAGKRRAERKKNRKKKREDKKPAQGQQDKPDRVADALERMAGIVQPKETSERRERNRVTRQSVTNRVPRTPSGVESRTTTERRENQERLQQLWNIGNEIEQELTDIFVDELGLGDDSFDIDNPDHVKAVQDRIDDYLTNEVDWIRQAGARLQNFLDDLNYVKSLDFENDRVDPLENAPDSLKQIYAKVRAGQAASAALMATSLPIPDRKTPKQLTADRDRIRKINRGIDSLLSNLEDSLGRLWNVYGDKGLIGGLVKFNPKNPDHIKALEESLKGLLNNEDANVRIAGAKFQRRVDVVKELQAVNLNQTSKDNREGLSDVAKNWLDQIMKDNKLTEGSIDDPLPRRRRSLFGPPPEQEQPPRPRGLFGTIPPPREPEKPKTPQRPKRPLFGEQRTPDAPELDEFGQDAAELDEFGKALKDNEAAVKLEALAFKINVVGQLTDLLPLGDEEFDINNDMHVDALITHINGMLDSDDEDDRLEGLLAFYQGMSLRHIENNEDLSLNTEKMPQLLQAVLRGRALEEGKIVDYRDTDFVEEIFGIPNKGMKLYGDAMKEQFNQKLDARQRTQVVGLKLRRNNVVDLFEMRLGVANPTEEDVVEWVEEVSERLQKDEYVSDEELDALIALREEIKYVKSAHGAIEDAVKNYLKDTDEKFEENIEKLLTAQRKANAAIIVRRDNDGANAREAARKYFELQELDVDGLKNRLLEIEAELLEIDDDDKEWRKLKQLVRVRRDIEESLLPIAEDRAKARVKRRAFDKGRKREQLEGYRPTAAGLLRRIASRMSKRKSVDNNRDENGFNRAKPVPVGNAGIQTTEDAVNYVENGGDLSEVPDEFLTYAIRSNAGQGKRFKRISAEADGINGIEVFLDRNGSMYGIKYGDYNMSGEHEDVHELLGHHMAERLGIAQGGVRIGKSDEDSYGDLMVPIVLDLAQNLHGMEIFHPNQDPDGPPRGWVETANAANLVVPTILDAILFNPDRHGGNFFVSRDPDTGETFFIPIDHGLAFDGWNDEDLDVDGMSEYEQLELWAEYFGDRNQIMKELATRLRSGDQEDREAVIAALKEAQELLAQAETDLPLSDAIRDFYKIVDPNRPIRRQAFEAERRAKFFSEMEPDEFIEWILDWEASQMGAPPRRPKITG